MTATTTEPEARPLPFGVALVPFVVLGLGIRLAYAVGWRFHVGLQYDGPVYVARARFLREGRGFTNPDELFFHGRISQGAVHPPGNALLLALAQQLRFATTNRIQVFGCLVGAATIVVVGLLGREVAGRRVGLVAAAIAAVHPGFWSYDPTAMAETPGQLLVALSLLLGYRFWRTPSALGAAYLGGALGLAALTRSELAILVPLLVVPLCLTAPGTGKQVALRLGAATLWVAMVLAPWVGWNVVRFEHPVTLASGLDLSLAYANCEPSFYGPDTGYWNLFCASVIQRDARNEFADESELGTQFRAQAGAYIADHRGRWPVVLAARVGRTLSTYPVVQQIRVEHERESREVPVLIAATAATWLTYALAAVAFWRPPRSRRHLLPLLMPLAAGVAGAAITFGTSRYRSAGEVGLTVLAAVGIDALLRWRAAARAAAAEAPPVPAPGSAPEPAPAP